MTTSSPSFPLPRTCLALLFVIDLGAGGTDVHAGERDTLCSSQADGTGAMEIEFVNESSQPVSFHWMGVDCVEGGGPVLAPGQRETGISHPGHVFRVRGQAEQTLRHYVASDDTRRFVVDDALIARVAKEGEPYTEGTCSPRTRERLTVEFVNLLNEPINMQWIGFDCEVHTLRSIPAHGRTREGTYIGHVFRFVDSNGAQLRSLDIAADESTYHVSAH